MLIRLLVAIVTTLIGIQAYAQSADAVPSFLRMVHSPQLSIDGTSGSGTKTAVASFLAPRAIPQNDEFAKSGTATRQVVNKEIAANTEAASEAATATRSVFDGLDQVRRLNRGDSAVFEQKIGRMLRDVFGDWKKYDVLKKASRNGDPEASFELAQAMIKAARRTPGSRFNNAVYSQASWWLSVSAKNGNNSALLVLAEMVEAGQGVEKDVGLAKDMYAYLAAIDDERGKSRIARLEQKLEQETIASDLEAVRRGFQARIKWDPRLAYYETLTSAKPYFFEEKRDDIVPLLPNEAIILIVEDLDVHVQKSPGKRATYQSDKFDNILFIRQEQNGKEIFLSQFSEKDSGITYYLLFELNEIHKNTGDPQERQKFFIGYPRLYPHLFEVAQPNKSGKGYSTSGLEDKMGEKHPNAFKYLEIGGQVIRDYDWTKLPADNLHKLLAFSKGVHVIRQRDDTALYPQMVVLDKNDRNDMANFELMEKEKVKQMAKIKARPEKSCLQASVRGRFSRAMNAVGSLTNVITGSRGSVFPKLRCDEKWCYAANNVGGARISLIPVNTPDCDPISVTTSSCTFSTEFGTGVGGVGLSFNNPIADAILQRAMQGQPLGMGKADFDIEKCEIIGPMEYTNPEGETFVFN